MNLNDDSPKNLRAKLVCDVTRSQCGAALSENKGLDKDLVVDARPASYVQFQGAGILFGSE